MDYRLLGRSGLKVSSLSIGTVTFGNDGSWGETGLKDAQRQIDLCLDHGINLIDTANVYNAGKSESMISEALVDGRRDRLLISSKVRFPTGKGPNDQGLSRWHIIRECENSLQRLKTDVIDIYHVHEWDGMTPLEETVEALDTLVKQGKIRYAATDLEAVGYTLVEDNAGGGFAVGLEAGHRFDLDDKWVLTPQAQLSYAAVDFDDFTDHFGSEISLDQGQSLLGRIGLAVDYGTEGVDENGLASTSKVYGIANLTYEFLDGATVVVSGTDLSYSGQKFGAELGLGGTLEWANGAQALHGELIGSSSLEGSYALKGTLGFTGRF